MFPVESLSRKFVHGILFLVIPKWGRTAGIRGSFSKCFQENSVYFLILRQGIYSRRNILNIVSHISDGCLFCMYDELRKREVKNDKYFSGKGRKTFLNGR